MKKAEEYLLQQALHWQEIALYVCDVVQQIAPTAKLLYKWNIPFFYLNDKPFIYINVQEKKKQLDVGFFYGNQLQQNESYFTVENRKLVKLLRYFSINTIPDKILREAIKEAASLK